MTIGCSNWRCCWSVLYLELPLLEVQEQNLNTLEYSTLELPVEIPPCPCPTEVLCVRPENLRPPEPPNGCCPQCCITHLPSQENTIAAKWNGPNQCNVCAVQIFGEERVIMAMPFYRTPNPECSVIPWPQVMMMISFLVETGQNRGSAVILNSSLFVTLNFLTETAGLTLGLEKDKDVVLTDCWANLLVSSSSLLSLCLVFWEDNRDRAVFTRALDVTDDGAGLVVHELDADLGNTTARACAKKSNLVSISASSPKSICPSRRLFSQENRL